MGIFTPSNSPQSLVTFGADFVLCLLGVALIFFCAHLLNAVRPFSRLCGGIATSLYRRLGRTDTHAILTCSVWGLVVICLVALMVRQPEPFIHDEFSYLLAADTFAHGRLTNPSPENASAFESMHILVQPTYMSKYPPGQGMLLATGQILGDPTIGLWFGAGLICGLVCWCALAFVPRRHAFTIGMLAAFHPLLLKWSQNYWGGYVALIGGLLVVGAAQRIVRSLEQPERFPLQARFAVLLGLGIGVLANSRMFEGGLLAMIVVAPPFLARLTNPTLWKRVVPLFVAVLLVVGAWMAYYNFRVTGSPTVLPYMLHEKRYMAAPSFLWQKERPAPPTLRHESMKAVALYWAIPDFHKQHDAPLPAIASKLDMLTRSPTQLFDLSTYLFNPPNVTPWYARLFRYAPFAIVFFVGGYLAATRKDTRSRRRLGTLLLSLTAFTVCLLAETYMHPHYAAPAGGLFVGIVAIAWQHAHTLRWRGKRIGRPLIYLLSLLILSSFISNLIELRQPSWALMDQDRRPVIDFLLSKGGKHLVLVDYGPRYTGGGEWVYNGADLENAPIVWARYLTPTENQSIIGHYKDRKVVRLQVGRNGIRSVPLDPMDSPTKAGEKKN